MKLDFSALAQPAAKARGQVGTTGTPAFTRVCVPPPAQPGAGTTGDKPAAAVLAPDAVLAIPAVCPPVSPACPQAANAEILNAGAVSPVSPLFPTETAQVAPAVSKTPVSTLVSSGQAWLKGEYVNTCGNCLHLLRRGTCGVPVAAGLLTAEEGFGIVWPTEGHGADCAAFDPKSAAKVAAAKVAGKVSPADAAETAALTARMERFALLGRADADDLAERLTQRDRGGDDRRLCLECTWLGDTGRCLAAATGRIPGADRRLEPVQTILQHCPAFGLRKGLE